jgi:hypothetical protein
VPERYEDGMVSSSIGATVPARTGHMPHFRVRTVGAPDFTPAP